MKRFSNLQLGIVSGIAIFILFGAYSALETFTSIPGVQFWFKAPSNFDECIEAKGLIKDNVCWFQKTSFIKQAAITHTEQPTAVYRDPEKRFSIEYDKTLFIPDSLAIPYPPTGEKLKAFNLVHSIHIRHCGLSGLPEHCTPTTENPRISLSVLLLSVSEAAKSFGSIGVPVEEKKFDSRTGYSLELGVEGEGITYNLLPLSPKQTLLVAYTTLDESILADYKNAPGFIPRFEQTKLVETIIKTLSVPAK